MTLPHKDPTHPLRADKVTRVLLLVLIAVIVLGVATVLVALRPKSPRVVLDNPSPQDVSSRIPNVPGAAATVDQDILVSGEKCNLTGDPLDVYGEVTWRPVFPPDVGIVVATGHAVRQPGCQEFSFVNDVPGPVVERTAELIESTGAEFVVWQIAGVETPQCLECAPGYWHTESFRLYLEDPNG